MRPLTNPGTARAFAALAALGLTYAVSADEPLGANAQNSVPAPQPQGRLTPVAVTAQHRNLDVLSGHRATVTGAVAPASAGREVALQVRGRKARWATVARARTGAGGRYRLSYVTNHTGSQLARVEFGGDGVNAATTRRVGRLNVYRQAGASWYGGGGPLACGGTLDNGTLGVANKTLPCGTMLTLRYHGRSVRVPVVDRGPYVAGREFDLTPATKARLGFGDIGEVWTTS
jgi:peptidoglycan lytic transglycosylase